MDKNKRKFFDNGRFRFLSITWWILHIILVLLVFYLIRVF
ncbi:hypothetical protein HNR33_002028 [Brassicibacter mesophilus]